MTRRFALLAAAAAATTAFAAACGSPPTKEEGELEQRATHPEVLAGTATDQSAPPGADQAGTNGAGGPVSDQGSAQGDTTGTR
ncbi:MAG TPA: hypothetical protein VM346_07370 [Sphingomicrobium sp.]|nr:hypothetical protein [Sphingomicrobium sp.]